MFASVHLAFSCLPRPLEQYFPGVVKKRDTNILACGAYDGEPIRKLGKIGA